MARWPTQPTQSIDFWWNVGFKYRISVPKLINKKWFYVKKRSYDDFRSTWIQLEANVVRLHCSLLPFIKSYSKLSFWSSRTLFGEMEGRKSMYESGLSQNNMLPTSWTEDNCFVLQESNSYSEYVTNKFLVSRLLVRARQLWAGYVANLTDQMLLGSMHSYIIYILRSISNCLINIAVYKTEINLISYITFKAFDLKICYKFIYIYSQWSVG